MELSKFLKLKQMMESDNEDDQDLALELTRKESMDELHKQLLCLHYQKKLDRYWKQFINSIKGKI